MSNDEAISTGLTLDEVAKLFPLRRKTTEDPGARVSSVFFISGETLDRSACTAAVGMEPSQFLGQRIRGRFMPSGRPNILPPEWSLTVEHEPTLELDPCMAELLAMLWPRRSEIKTLLAGSGCAAAFGTHVIVFEFMPICTLTPTTLTRLAEFGLDWNFSWHDVTPLDAPENPKTGSGTVH
jgi:hypothetical protein